MTYVLGPASHLLQEVGIDGVHLRQVGLALLSQEVVHILLGGDLLHELVDVHLLESFLRLCLLHRVVHLVSNQLL
jgi:hypothetical protein